MDGLLLIDKPSGPTSHDVVARLRRSSREQSVGHTGTLDPRATGLLPLVFGRATRLASFLTGREKTYDAAIRLGIATDTDDADGVPVGAPVPAPSDVVIDDALARFRGVFEQVPPVHSAKRVGGERAYDMARRAETVTLKPVTVTVTSLDRTSRQGDVVHLLVTASAGFYVRSLARDLGTALGCGGHLTTLRRLRSGSFDVAEALTLDEAEALGAGIAARLLTPSEALPDLTPVQVTDAGLKRALHGNPLGPEHLDRRWVPPPTGAGPVKLLAGTEGRLVALAHSRGGALHPVVVLG